ncbi:SOSS complex subunit B1 [Lunasporangiospora selenospora]|uniref:SOSS complex subunit B1 n=1 Tax=Lunasporangiospora selenospora TaxID=979761 RepID=A0A9P6KA12_9FUNG|nr:SOSS complex subunit B1 [Lunasporangiospora selenospora]
MRPIPAPTSGTSANGLPLTFISDLRPAMRGFNLECVLLEKAADPRRTYDNQLLTTFLVADKTGSIVLIIWGEEGKLLRNGDLLRIQGGEAKLFRGLIQLSTSKFGKYKKIGEDTMTFCEKPNWSEFEWMADPNKPNMMIPITPQMKMNLASAGPSTARAPGSVAPSINPAFRGDQHPRGPGGPRSFPQQQQSQQQQQQPPLPPPPPPPPNQVNNMPGNGMPGPGMMMNGGGAPGGYSNKGSFNGGGPNNPQQQPQQQGSGGNVRPFGNNGSLGGNGNSINSNNNISNNNSANSNDRPHSSPRHPKFNKHNKTHRDLDAPDSYPSPRGGAGAGAGAGGAGAGAGAGANGDDFARDMKLVSSQGGGSVGLGMRGGGHSHGGHGHGGRHGHGQHGGGHGFGQDSGIGGPAGSGHLRKKPKIEME